jgi:subtilisin family serine protease
VRFRAVVAMVAAASIGTMAAGVGAARASGPPKVPAAAARPGGMPGFVPGEALVRFRPRTSVADEARANREAGGTVTKSFDLAVPGLRLVRLAPGVGVDAALARYRSSPAVLYAEPNRVWGLAGGRVTAPNDPQFPTQWDWNNTGQIGGKPDADVDAPEAWDHTTGDHNVVVAVIDTGIDYRHPDLKANVWDNTAECTGIPGVDDDGNGYVDDCHGIDTINGDSDPFDDFGHGTHVSGTIGAVGNNGKGVTGLNWHVQIMACKSHDAAGNATTASVVECFQYVQMEKQRFGVDVVATNNSWGGCPEACGYSRALRDAIAGQLSAGILTVAAAGNDGSNNDTTPFYPADYYLPNVIAVAATTNRDALASFSDFGARTVSVGAPGQDVYSTLPGDAYGYLSGTSMASPHVAGLAALIAAQDPSLDWRAIRNLILAGGDPKGSVAGTTITGTRVNANGSLTCSGVPVFGVLRPLESEPLGGPLTVAALNIDCAAAAGSLTVTIDPGGTTFALRDRGRHPDLAKGDGVYSGSWTPSAAGTYTLSFSNGRTATVVVG